MAIQLECNEDILASLRRVIDYLEVELEEAEDFEINPTRDHIWVEALVVKAWLAREATKFTRCPGCGRIAEKDNERWGAEQDGELCRDCREEDRASRRSETKPSRS